MSQAAVIPVTGDQYEIEAGAYQATIVALGAGLRKLSHDGRALIVSYAADRLPPNAAGQILIPWPNRIDQGSYKFDGEDRQLDVNDHTDGNAIHGLTRWTAWRLVSAEADRVTLGHQILGSRGYPHVLDLFLAYELSPKSGLTVTLSATNCGQRLIGSLSRLSGYHSARSDLTHGRPTRGASDAVPVTTTSRPLS